MPNVKFSIQMDYELDVPETQLASMLMRAEMQPHPELTHAIGEEDHQTGLARATVSPPPHDGKTSTDPPAAKLAAKSAAAAKPRAPRPATGNGAERKPLTEPEMRALLTDVSSTHPQKVAAVVALLQTHGGSARLLDCPQEKWLEIEDAARGVLAELQQASG